MTESAAAELENIKRELNSIIRELEDISWGVRSDFKGIGNDLCANSIDASIDKYRRAKYILDTLDTTKVREGFAE